jgi:dTDP-4-amino-4,6-dideoxygalactose transaminase
MLEFPTEGNHTGRRMGEEELALLEEVVRSGALNSTGGTVVKQLEAEFAALCGAKYCTAVSSGTAAIHTALAAINPEPGDEVITTTITDMGALTPIIYQCAIPVFADVDPQSYNVTAQSIARVITPRTRAVIVTHLFGAPCEMAPILELAAAHNIPVIEDAAQAPLAEYHGRRVGTFGTIGCFSLQQSKHMTAGEGGFVVTDDPDLALRMKLFHNKGWGYGDAAPDHYFLALNYRMTELQGAVARAQLGKVEDVVRDKQLMAEHFGELIADLPGIAPQTVPDNTTSVYWRYAVRIDEAEFGATVDQIARFLGERYNIWASAHYVRKPAFQCQIFRERNTFGSSGFPFEGPHRAGLAPVEYRDEEYPGSFEALAHMLVLPWNENFKKQHLETMAHALHEAARHFGEGGS